MCNLTKVEGLGSNLGNLKYAGSRGGRSWNFVDEVTEELITLESREAIKASRLAPKINLKHIFHGEINKKGKAVGFHHRGSIGHAGKARVTSVGPKNAQGVYKGKIEIFNPITGNWVNKGPKSTFYPDEWSRLQVLSEIRGAYNNRISVVGKPSNYWEGISPRNIRIGGYFDISGNINTAFPYF